MARRPRRNQSPAFKVKVAVPAIGGKQTMTKQAQEFDVHPIRIRQCRGPLLEGATGGLTLEGDCLSGARGTAR